ncbi:hypothetical protein K469DRAFT_689528 [Zopfia rhizophila CBS 207.26]|uniref:Uncharacterized protein n=1 Tax=Zopfia rhizophila CBS 207.26 TaxID=1314779 RepID=A0A6A6E245_9PEZI|nr:hypothetical protein K469DRAFT_689528 [Zopfia rhizophila CBS 207.26]
MPRDKPPMDVYDVREVLETTLTTTKKMFKGGPHRILLELTYEFTKTFLSLKAPPYMKKMGEITGFKQVARPYCLRYGSRKAFDKDGNISDALRNLIMQHADTRTFLRHYLSRRVTADTQAIIHGVAPQDDIMQAACRMSRWINPERA